MSELPRCCPYCTQEDFEEAAKELVAAEREACAKIADEHNCEDYDCLCEIHIAAAIRARGAK